ncbi:hypothetical protein M3J09_000158 [Ascochyta lentis]
MDRMVCQSDLQEELNFAGISHALPSEKRDTGGGDKGPCRAGSSCGIVNGRALRRDLVSSQKEQNRTRRPREVKARPRWRGHPGNYCNRPQATDLKHTPRSKECPPFNEPWTNRSIRAL